MAQGGTFDTEWITDKAGALSRVRKQTPHAKPRTSRVGRAHGKQSGQPGSTVLVALSRMSHVDARHRTPRDLEAPATLVELARPPRYDERLVPEPGLTP